MIFRRLNKNSLTIENSQYSFFEGKSRSRESIGKYDYKNTIKFEIGKVDLCPIRGWKGL
jgi:hypothetical protein